MPLFVPLTILVLAYIAISAPAVAQQDGAREYQDSAWGTVMLPQGEKSFADRVVAYPPGIGTINETARDPRAILGPPDFSGDVNDGSFLSLGCDGSVIIQFSDNALIDVAGPDLYVFEVGPNVEGINLAISEDGASWIDLGDISGGRAEVELAGLVPADASFRFVRLTDDGVECGTRFTEADFDAVAAIGSTLRFVLDGAVLFGVDSTELRTDAQAALDALAQEIAAAGLSEFRVVGHTDSSGSYDYNLALSQARALAVRDYLGARPILAAATITADGLDRGYRAAWVYLAV